MEGNSLEDSYCDCNSQEQKPNDAEATRGHRSYEKEHCACRRFNNHGRADNPRD